MRSKTENLLNCRKVDGDSNFDVYNFVTQKANLPEKMSVKTLLISINN